MSEPVNLNKFRKAKARVDRTTHADANAVLFGRTKGEKDQQAHVADKAVRLLDGHKREGPKQ
ncbi:MAG: hypothetical protein ACI9KK_003038 [Ascidiaceihabitans sp.]|jgi:hypothetical protein